MFRFVLVVAILFFCDRSFSQQPKTPPAPGMYWQQSDKFHHDRKWVQPEKQDEASFLGTDGIWHPKPGACWCGIGLSGKWVMPKQQTIQYVLINGRLCKVGH